jgi:hypothetical protein
MRKKSGFNRGDVHANVVTRRSRPLDVVDFRGAPTPGCIMQSWVLALIAAILHRLARYNRPMEDAHVHTNGAYVFAKRASVRSNSSVARALAVSLSPTSATYCSRLT